MNAPSAGATGSTKTGQAADLRLRAIGSETLTTSAYEALKKAITAMRIYDEGTNLRLDERALAAGLGISRTPVREALVKLEHEGLVRTVPRRGVYVVRKSKAEILDIISATAALEGMAARLAVERATPEQLERVAALCPSHHKKMSVEEYSAANVEFHQTVTELSGSRVIAEMLAQLQVHMRGIRGSMMTGDGRMEASMAEHCKIVEALVHGDASSAEQHAKEHALNLASYVKEHVTYLD